MNQTTQQNKNEFLKLKYIINELSKRKCKLTKFLALGLFLSRKLFLPVEEMIHSRPRPQEHSSLVGALLSRV